MQVPQRYILSRNARFSFRCHVTLDLRPFLPQREIKVSLMTDSPTVAAAMGRLLAAEALKLWGLVREPPHG